MDRRFTALRVIGTVFKILAWITLILGLLGAIGMLVVGFTLSGAEGPLGLNLGGPLAGIAMFFVVLIIAIISFLSLYAVGESVYLLLSVEENTRRSAYILQQQYTSAYQAGYPPSHSPSPNYED
jgi:ABC-type long-subunit fatty acid transport system fused permease/ATPase subunit